MKNTAYEKEFKTYVSFLDDSYVKSLQIIRNLQAQLEQTLIDGQL